MRYVVVDLAGNQRASFESRAELLDELREGSYEDPESLRSFYVITYDDDGHEGVAQRGDKVLAHGAQLVWSSPDAARNVGNLGRLAIAVRSADIPAPVDNETDDRVASADSVSSGVTA